MKNTKTDGISSGLVAEFWLSIDCIGERYLCFSKPQDDDELHPLVRLSDAEEIILKLSNKDRYGVCDECGTPYSFDPTDGGTICVKCQKDKITKQAERITELEQQVADLSIYKPCRRKDTPHVPVKAIGPCDFAKWGIIIETDKEFAARAGQPHQEVTE